MHSGLLKLIQPTDKIVYLNLQLATLQLNPENPADLKSVLKKIFKTQNFQALLLCNFHLNGIFTPNRFDCKRDLSSVTSEINTKYLVFYNNNNNCFEIKRSKYHWYLHSIAKFGKLYQIEIFFKILLCRSKMLGINTISIDNCRKLIRYLVFYNQVDILKHLLSKKDEKDNKVKNGRPLYLNFGNKRDYQSILLIALMFRKRDIIVMFIELNKKVYNHTLSSHYCDILLYAYDKKDYKMCHFLITSQSNLLEYDYLEYEENLDDY